MGEDGCLRMSCGLCADCARCRAAARRQLSLKGGLRATFRPLAPPPPRGVTGGVRRLCGSPSQNDESPRAGRSGAVLLWSGISRPDAAGSRIHATLGPSHGPAAKSHPAVRRPRRQRVVSGATSTTAAEDVTRGRPTAPSRTGRPCASRTAGRSCRPDSRTARPPGGAARRRVIRTGTAVASEPWADASSRRSRREGHGPARQACAAGAGRVAGAPDPR
jgi:hypothetical protein